MPNVLSQANARTMPIDRRAALAALASGAALALPAPAQACAPSGAILAAIACQRAALGAFQDACARADDVAALDEGRDVSEADLAAHEAADAAEGAAMDAVFALPIRTPVVSQFEICGA
jgi:hypothetical protein